MYGSEKDAVDLLSFIDNNMADVAHFPKQLLTKVKTQYDTNSIYHNVIDEMIAFIKNTISVEDIDYISGGERRDWFFSNIIAYLLKKPHITIFKDHETLVSDYDFSNTESLNDLSGKKVVHVTDLVTSASSFTRFWVPSIKDLGGEMVASCYIVDRKQGGTELLQNDGIKTISLTSIDIKLFKEAFKNVIINEEFLHLL